MPEDNDHNFNSSQSDVKKPSYEEANLVLSGADTMMTLVNNALSLGSNSIVREAYQIKSRVKDAESLIEKVEKKRIEGDVGYSINDVRDIVGFRFLTLFKPNLVSLVEVFVDFLEKYQGHPAEVFIGNNLVESIEEVKVYQSKASETDYVTIYKFLRGYLRSRGFSPDFVSLEEKDTRYSSVHFIVKGQVIKAGQSKIFPIEFQLRTVFEDVWSEIEHKLLYKNSEIKSTDEKYRFGSSQIRGLKLILDGCSDNADSSFLLLAPSSAEQESASSLSSNTVKVLDGIEDVLPSSAHEEIKRIREKIIAAYRDVAARSSDKTKTFSPSTFTDLIETLSDFKSKWEAHVASADAPAKATFDYAIDMEIAAANYWAGQAYLIGSIEPGEAPKDGSESGASKFFQRAQQVYFDLTAIDGFAKDPVLNFRVGQTYRAFGKSDLAITYFEAATAEMKRPDWKDKHSIFEILIPRHLGYMYWAQAERAYSNSPGYTRGEDPYEWVKQNYPVQSRVLRDLLKAYRATANIDLKEVSKDIDPTRNLEVDRALAYNNTLDYGVEYVKFGGNVEDLATSNGGEAFDQSFYNRLYDYFSLDDRSTTRIELLDTFVNAAVLFGDKDRGQQWLAELEARVENGVPEMRNKWIALVVNRTIANGRRALLPN
jgi:ppGpp synthetase/RelA/SpoT-type nucleotidyltranferase